MAPLPVVPEEGFEERLRALGRVVVCFTADWCPHCQRFAPAFAKAAAQHKDQRFAVADISDDDNDARWDRYAIEVVPTVLVFEDGRPAARLDGALGRGIAPAQLEALLRGAGQRTLG